MVRPEPERRLLASLAEVGQQVPIVVVKQTADDQFVVIDGYKRVRALRRLGRDTVTAGCWPGEEAEALIAARRMQTAEPETALEQAGCWPSCTSALDCPWTNWPDASATR